MIKIDNDALQAALSGALENESLEIVDDLRVEIGIALRDAVRSAARKALQEQVDAYFEGQEARDALAKFVAEQIEERGGIVL